MGARSRQPNSRNTIDFLKLRGLLRDAAKQAFSEVRDAHPDETVYAFALVTDDGAMAVGPAANTEQGLRRRAEHYGYSKPEDLSYLRWAPAEWGYEDAGGNHFQAAYDHLNLPGRDEGPEDKFVYFLGSLIEAMVGALKDLDDAGFFGKGKEREAVTLFVTVTDSDLAEAVEKRSSKELNPPAVHKAFMKR